MTVRIGTSGYAYRHWRGVLYPEGLPASRWLQRYAERFDTVELNATFYRLPTATAVAGWAARVPPGFRFAVKGSRFLTHQKRLLDPADGLRRFCAPLAGLGSALGPTLWQLPPQLGPDLARLDRFLARLPPGRHAVEFRDPAWYGEGTCALLDRYGAAFCQHDRVADPPPRATGGWRYLRFHGPTGAYDGGYGPARLRPVADDLGRWGAEGGEAWVFFNNDVGGHAVRDALLLRELLGQQPAAELTT